MLLSVHHELACQSPAQQTAVIMPASFKLWKWPQTWACRFSLEAQHGSSGQPRGKSRNEQVLAPWSASQPCASRKGVRYRDGFAVASKGEKHIEVPCKEDWNGGSSGKVLTKGKRGKGFV